MFSIMITSQSLILCVCVFQGHKDSAFGCVFSPGGELLVCGSEQLDEENSSDSEERSERWTSLNREQDDKDDGYTNLFVTWARKASDSETFNSFSAVGKLLEE